MKPALSRLLLLMLLVCGISGCPTKVDDSAKDSLDPSALIIGLIQPSASGSELAREQAARLAVNEINAAGGINGQSVALLVEFDDNNSPDAGITAAQNMVSRGAVAIIGANSSRVTLPVAEQVTIPADIALIAHGATSPLITDLADNDTVYRIPPSDALQGRLLAELVWNEGITNIALYVQDDAYGQGLRSAFTTRFTQLGGAIQAEAIASADKTSDFGTEIDSLYSAGAPSALAIFAFDRASSNLLREILTIKGSLPQLYGVDSNMTLTLLENAPSQVAGMRGTTPGARNDRPEYQAFVSRFYSATGVDVSDPNTGNTYDAVYLVALALAQAGSNGRSGVIANLRAVSGPDTGTPVTIGPGEIAQGFAAIGMGADVDYQGVTNNIDFDANGDPTAATYHYLEIVNTGNGLQLQLLQTIDLP